MNEEDNSSEGNSESTETPTPVLRPEAGSYVANLAAANTLFVMRLNDRAGETRYIDPVTEQERSSRLWLRQIGGHNAWRDSNGQLRTTSHRYVSQGCMPPGLPMTSVKKAHTLTPGRNIAGLKTR